jgi:protein-S-isoprenylcysteine O-methyltransferase Ste14
MPVVSVVLDFLSIFIALFSVGIIVLAIRTLGKQWNVGAILVEGHTLITSGPYRVIRHPIYLGMVGLMVSAGISTSIWECVLLAIVFAVPGVILQIKAEEQLLKSQFGREYESYQRKVSAFIPGIY